MGGVSCNKTPSNHFILNGYIEGADNTEIIRLNYMYLKDNKWHEISDSTKLIEGKFSFEGNMDEVTGAYLSIDQTSVQIYLEPTKMKLTIDKSRPYTYELSGTSVEKESIELRNLLSDYLIISDSTGDSIQDIFKQIDLHNNEPALVDSLMQRAYYFKDKATINAQKSDSIKLDFIVKHTTYQIIPHLLYTLSRNNLISIDTITSIYNNLPEHSKVTLSGKLASAQMKETQLSLNIKDLSTGETAPDFSKENIQGETIKLSDFRTKNYVLLDFWASWCGPCVKQIPQLKKIQDTYADKGLKIIGVSLDGDEKEWRNAVEKHQVGTWIQVSGYSDPDDYFSKAGDISVIYNIKAIPVYILIDKQGKILKKWQHIGDQELEFIDNILKQET
ncbi:peroxiredoxin [Dysgonomonas alginatilytica]|uniref:Peroxiredoxin n=2 Tax=Dysgonomonas alginatilytica TaxID=1605892 RepID=A0A2V3PTP1_9BACT|nr:peroxiredoxin [Dysgonomonas alginatilytica]